MIAREIRLSLKCCDWLICLTGPPPSWNPPISLLSPLCFDHALD